jgi:hypothetical protein
LDGRVHEFGKVYAAYIARFAREHGIEVVHDERTGAARFTAITPEVRDLFSKRTVEAEAAAKNFARDKGLDWEKLSGAQRVALLHSGAAELRNKKDRRQDARGEFADWQSQAKAIGYRHQSVLGAVPVREELAPEQRHQAAWRATQGLLADEFSRRAVISKEELRVIAARGLTKSMASGRTVGPRRWSGCGMQ